MALNAVSDGNIFNLKKSLVRKNGSYLTDCRIGTSWVTSTCCYAVWEGPASVTLLVPGGVLSDTREFFAKDVYAWETEWRRVVKPRQRVAAGGSQVG